MKLDILLVTIINIQNKLLKDDHRSKFSNLSNWKEEAWKKNQGFNGIRTRDLRIIAVNFPI